MSAFSRLTAAFNTNWTTILVGWEGLGVFSPWPDRSDEFPPLIAVSELAAYAEKRLGLCSNVKENALIVELLSLHLYTERKEIITNLLRRLTDLDGGDPILELRKWRLSLLEELLDRLPSDAINGLVALSEFWQSFGFPSDSPHVVQGMGNTITPVEYYQDQNFQRLLACHREWVRDEKASLKQQDSWAEKGVRNRSDESDDQLHV